MRIPACEPAITTDDLFALMRALEQRGTCEGDITLNFEERLAEFFGVRRATTLASPTAALYVALKALRIGAGDEVIVPDFAPFSTVTAVVLAGATPVLVDVDEYDFNLSVPSAEASLSDRTRAIIPVHVHGQTCDLMAIMALARRHNLRVIEDATQAAGATFGEKPVGTFGDIGCISFDRASTIALGDGAALITDDEALAERCRRFTTLGRSDIRGLMHESVGADLRLPEMLAAMGTAQLNRIDDTICRKRWLLAAYHEQLCDCPGVRPARDNGFGDTVPTRVAILVEDPAGLNRFLADRHIETQRMFYPLHLQPALTAANSIVREKPIISVRLFERGLILPGGTNLTLESIREICENIAGYQRDGISSTYNTGLLYG